MTPNESLTVILATLSDWLVRGCPTPRQSGVALCTDAVPSAELHTRRPLAP